MDSLPFTNNCNIIYTDCLPFHGYASRMHWHMSMHPSRWTTQAAASVTRLISYIMCLDWLDWRQHVVDNNLGNVHGGWLREILISGRFSRPKVFLSVMHWHTIWDALTSICITQMLGCIENKHIHISNILFNGMRNTMEGELPYMP